MTHLFISSQITSSLRTIGIFCHYSSMLPYICSDISVIHINTKYLALYGFPKILDMYLYLLYHEVYISCLKQPSYVFVAHFYFNVFSAFWNIFLWPLNIFITSCRFIVSSKKETNETGVNILRMYKLVLYHCKSKHQKLYCCLTFVIKKMDVFTNMQR